MAHIQRIRSDESLARLYLFAASLGGQLGVPDVAQARQDWILNCQGCHRADALTRSGGAPTLAGSVSGFLAIPAGRDSLVRVPGVAFAWIQLSEHARRKQMASAKLRDELGRSGLFHVISNAPAQELIDRLKSPPMCPE
jgi:hypothetical protein